MQLKIFNINLQVPNQVYLSTLYYIASFYEHLVLANLFNLLSSLLKTALTYTSNIKGHGTAFTFL